MYDLLVRLNLLGALAQLGVSIADLEDCHSRKCIRKIERHSYDVLRIQWKPISEFPEEARRFR